MYHASRQRHMHVVYVSSTRVCTITTCLGFMMFVFRYDRRFYKVCAASMLLVHKHGGDDKNPVILF